MITVKFEEANAAWGAGQKEYRPLPAHKVPGDPQGQTVFCWKLGLRERLRVLVTGCIWHSVLTFKLPLQPQMLSVEKPMMRKPEQPV